MTPVDAGIRKVRTHRPLDAGVDELEHCLHLAAAPGLEARLHDLDIFLRHRGAVSRVPLHSRNEARIASCLRSGLTRTATTDEHARRRFRRYSTAPLCSGTSDCR